MGPRTSHPVARVGAAALCPGRSGRARTRVHRLALAIVGLGWLLATTCGDGPTGPAPELRPLYFDYIVHPGLVDPGALVAIEAGIFVGPDLCWQIRDAEIRQQGDTLRLLGTAVETSTRGAACALALAYDTVELRLPPLPPGRYFLVADDLVDTLLVDWLAPRPAVPHFVAHGHIVSTACPRFDCRYGRFRAVSGFLENPPPMPYGAYEGTLRGIVVGETDCGGVHDRNLRLRSFEPGHPSWGTRPLTFEYLLHPGALAAGVPGEVEAGAFVGFDGCWSILGAGISLRSDSLVLAGTAMYSGPPGVGCPDVLVYDILHVAIPPLAKGRYFLVTETGLADTLVVRTPDPEPSGPFFVAWGWLCPPAPSPRCAPPEFTCRYTGFHSVEGDLENPPPVSSCTLGRLAGVITSRVPCDGGWRNQIRLRRWVPIERRD